MPSRRPSSLRILNPVLLAVLCLLTRSAFSATTQILCLGTDHLAQTYREGKPNTDVTQQQNQESLDRFIGNISAFHADAVMIEVLPSEQERVDREYSKFLDGTLEDSELEYPRHELYQLAFPLAKKLNLETVYCVNSIGSTSQGILTNGENIEIYQAAGRELRDLAMEKYDALAKGNLSFYDFLYFLNTPEAYGKIYQLRYIAPARVRNGTFNNPDSRVPPETFLEKDYIGAELISVFKNRDFKIYSNVVIRQLETGYQRILLITGTGHVGSLKSIFRDDPAFEVVDALDYL